MEAFALSVHVTLIPMDLPNLGPIVKKGMAEFELLYRTYRETLGALGEKCVLTVVGGI